MADPVQHSLLREVDEELRQEQYAKLWKKYGNYVIGAAVAFVLAVGGFQGWRHYDRATRMEESHLFAQAMGLAKAGRLDAARIAYARLADNAGAGYNFLARLREAAIRSKQGDETGAVAVYKELAANSDIDPVYRQLSVIFGVMHAIDSANPDTMAARLEPLTRNDNPWRHSARELMAMLAQRTGDRDKAQDLYTRLATDSTAPPGLRERAEEMLAILEIRE